MQSGNDSDELFFVDFDECVNTPHTCEDDELLLRVVANIRRRVEGRDEFYNPMAALVEEYDKCAYVVARTQQKVLAPDSWLGEISDSEYNDLMDDARRLEKLWDGWLTLKSRFRLGRLLGTIALDHELVQAYARCEEFTHREREGPFSLVLRGACAKKDALKTVKAFCEYADERSFLSNPFYVKPDEMLQGKEVSKTADQLSRDVWRYHASCTNSELLGMLLLEEDYGQKHVREMLRCG